ncbi:relaxin-3-like [Sardina pilchardus]|uniref:relaxin-3-like n=1 Tax=Sardina pilchardus TaxID=27697 RepID=UPI002E13DE94
MWAVVALGVCVCVMVCGVPALESPTYGVKLCGREFIRAVIFTCGGSRWKRSLSSTDLLQDSLDVLDDDQSAGRWLADADTLPSASLPADAAGAEPGEEVAQDWWMHHGGVFSRSARSLITNDILEALRSSDRKGRDVVVGLSNACCKWGCSKSEISSLC